MSKTRDTGFLGNVIKVDTSGNVSFVSGSTTLATINTTGQLSGSSPVLSSSYALNATSASNAELLDGLDSTQFTLTSSFAAQTASFTAFTASVNTFTASQNILNGTYATTGSNTFVSPQTINSNLVVTGSITAQTLVVSTINVTQSFSSGSNIFGNALNNTQTFTGSLLLTGSATFNGALTAGATILSGLLNVGSGSISSAAVNINSNNSTAAYLYFNGAGITNNHTAITGLEGATSNLKFYTANTPRLTIDSAGAATFSSSVQAGSSSATNYATLQIMGASTSPSLTTGTAANVVFAMAAGQELAITANGTAPYGVNFQARNSLAGGGGSGTSYPIIFNPLGGNVGIGTTTPSVLFTIGKIGAVNQLGFYDGATAKGFIGVAASTSDIIGTDVANDMVIRPFVGNLLFAIGGSEKMRILSGGSVLFGRTTAGLTNGDGTSISGGSVQPETNGYVFYGNRTSSDGLFIGIRRNNVDVGSISVTTSATAFNTSSDYRLKQDLKEFNGLSIINLIKTYDYEWKIDSSRAYGVIAHEIQEILPYIVFGEKDEINEDETIKPQAVDYSKLVPILVKAIQEQQAQINELKAQING